MSNRTGSALVVVSVVGKPLVSRVVVKQTGRIRQGPQKPWMQFTATESYAVDPPSFLWDAKARRGRLPLFTVRDSYADGKGAMQVKLAGLFPVVNARGPEMDHSSAVRFLNEMMWFPSAFLRPNITWRAIDDNSVEVSLVAYGRTVSANLSSTPTAELPISSRDVTRTSAEILGQPSGRLPSPRMGRSVGSDSRPKAKQSGMESGDFTYIDLRVEEITYDSDGSRL